MPSWPTAGRAEYAAVTLAGRLMASVGRDVLLDVDGTGPVRGELRRVGTGWCLVSGDAGDWLVPLAAITAAQGVSDRAVPEVAWSAVSRLGLGSALRRLADEGAACVVATRGGARHEVVLTRVGKDFVEAETVADPASGCWWRWRRSAPCRAASPADSGEDGDHGEHDVGQHRDEEAGCECRQRLHVLVAQPGPQEHAGQDQAIAMPRAGIRTTSTPPSTNPATARATFTRSCHWKGALLTMAVTWNRP
jgi:hypothetical protein